MPETVRDRLGLRAYARAGATACCAVLALSGPSVASADTASGGGATADPNGTLTDPAASGSAKASAARVPDQGVPPKPLLITCRTQCEGLDVVRAGGTVRVTGDGMQGARRVIFKGGKGGADDASAPATVVAPDAVDVVVPPTAHSGPVRVAGSGDAMSRITGKTITVVGPDSDAAAARASVAPAARVDTGKVFFRGAHEATLSVFVPDGAPQHLAVDVQRASDGAVVQHWELDAPGGTVQSVAWNGIARGSVRPDGRYRFSVRTSLSPAPLAASFSFLGNMFPIRGKHEYGSGAARYGSGRDGHTHQGQDVFAACGTPLVAARGGTVKFAGFQSAAGNYIVIDGAGTGTDYVYMHLKEPALAAKGDTVYTGQPIGMVGDTGDAVGCHLHFELWKTPGWYTGGSPMDPLASLQRWDKSS